MLAAVYRSFGGKIAIETLPRPVCPADGVVVEVKATGVCRSDWHGWKGHDSDIVDHGLPFVPGHELAGCVVEVGEGVGSLQVGDRVAVPFILSCGCCRECGRGRPTICERQQQPGFTQHGSFAEFVALPRADRNLCRIPDGVSYVEAAALGCRTTTAYRAVLQRGRLRAGESLAVFGCGGLGLSAVMIASSERRGGGAAGEESAQGKIIAVDVSHEARSKALELGATDAVDASLGAEAVQARIRELTGGVGVDVSIDAAGVASTCEGAVLAARRGGRMVQAGLPHGGPPPLVPMGRVVGRELEILGSHGLDAADMPAILQLVANGKLPVRSLIGREVSLQEGAAAIEAMDTGSPVGIVMVTRFR